MGYLAWLNFSLTGLVILLHVCCLLILWRYDKPKKQCFIITVLMAELFVGVLQLLIFIIERMEGTELVYHIINISAYPLNIPYCGGLVLLTLERYMEIQLHIKYFASFFYLNRCKLCVGLWVVNVGITCCSVTLIVLKRTPPLLNVYQINLYCLHVAHGVILILFFVVYIYLYRLFRRSVNRHQKQRKQLQLRATVLNTSKIFAPFLIVLTFICFMTVPLMLYIYMFPDSDRSWVLVLNRANSITDGLLYVLFNPRIRKKLLRKKYTTTNTKQQAGFFGNKQDISNKTSSSQQMSSV